jgi:hypothetical protein
VPGSSRDPRPPRPVLRPGTRLVRRSDGVLQAGLARDERVLLPDTPVNRRLATALARTDLALPPDAEESLASLSGLLVDAADLGRHRRGDPVRDGAVAATYARHGTSGTAVLAARAEARVHVQGPGPWVDRTAALLTAAGVGAVEGPEDGTGDVLDLRVLLHAREPDRGLVDEAGRADQPHVWAGATADGVRAGPFVVPGRTACRRCVDAGHSAEEPGWALLREQYVGPHGDVPDPVDPVGMSLAVAFAAGDVLRWLDGERPLTWSATVDLGATEPVRRAWPRHPACGCSWSGAWRASGRAG